MKLISFSFYYVKLRLGVWFGIHRTAHPLDVKWRWGYWQNKRRRKRY